MKTIRYINEVEIENKRVLLRVDFNVSLNPDFTIADDARIKQSLATINYLLKKNNRLIIVSHLGRPKKIDEKFSLIVVLKRLKQYLPRYPVAFAKTLAETKTKKEPVVVLENIRFFPQEKNYSTLFAQQLASLADVYVNDAFGVCHRSDTSIVGPPKFMPAYGGLLLKKEVEIITRVIKNPKKPFVAIIGGAKISTKIYLLDKLSRLVDYLIIGGGLANTFLSAQGLEIGQSFCEYESVQAAKKFLAKQRRHRPYILLPKDAVVAGSKNDKKTEIKKIEAIEKNQAIFDVGPKTLAEIGSVIAKAKTIIWNGPVGYFENPAFRRGTDFVYYSITKNRQAISIVGGGDTLAALSKKEHLEKITHISTGGGAMLELIEKGTLPGIEALKR